MSLFQAVRVFSALESVVFAALLTVAIGHISEDAATVLGWTHGVGFLVLFALIYRACSRRVMPWPVLASAVLLTPFGSSIHIELIVRRGLHGGAGRNLPGRTAA